MTDLSSASIAPQRARNATRAASPWRNSLRAQHRAARELSHAQRALPAQLPAALQAWLAGDPARFDEIVRADQATDALDRALAGLEQPMRSWLHDDIQQLLELAAQLSERMRLRLVFGPVRSDSCRKFHVDWVRWRLLTTYLGPGTEWLPEEAVAREAVGASELSPAQSNRLIVRDPQAVQHAQPGCVLWMRGALHGPRRGAVHRSPPIEARKLVRVVLSVTPLDD